MATRTTLAVVLAGLVQNVDLTADELQVASVRYGGGAGTLLTKTILDNLVALQNGSDFSTGTNAHTHDGRYFTETELGANTGTTGSDLIGDDDTYSNFTPAAATVKGALSGIDAALAAVGSLTEWQDSALDYVTDNTAVPASEVSGDRYILSHDGGAPHANYDGASAGDIVTFNGSVWVATTPTTGMFISADNESTLLYYWGGSSWTAKSFEATTASTGLTKVGMDVRLADAAENASGIKVLSGAITLEDLGAFDTADLAEGTNLYHTDERAQDAVGTILTDTATIDFTYNDGTPSVTADVKSNSISETHLTASVAGDGLTGGNGTALAVGAGTGISVTSDTVNVDYAPLVKKSMTAGESMAADTSFLVRWAVNGETAGRVYKATNATAAADGKFWVHGIALKGSAVSAGDAVDVVALGTHTLGASDTPFGGTDIGKAVWLTTAGGFSVTAPSSSGTAAYKVGTVETTTKIWMGDKQLTGIN